jgi:hypothetical protein
VDCTGTVTLSNNFVACANPETGQWAWSRWDAQPTSWTAGAPGSWPFAGRTGIQCTVTDSTYLYMSCVDPATGQWVYSQSNGYNTPLAWVGGTPGNWPFVGANPRCTSYANSTALFLGCADPATGKWGYSKANSTAPTAWASGTASGWFF